MGLCAHCEERPANTTVRIRAGAIVKPIGVCTLCEKKLQKQFREANEKTEDQA